jgi:hypothetical protein
MGEERKPDGAGRRGSLLETVKAVAAAFFGVRGRSAHEQDVSNLNPIHVIGVGIVLAALFVVGLVAIVQLVVA